MILYVIRHGRAEAASSQGGDSNRHLTQQGRELLKRSTAGLVRHRVEIDRIFSSPILRARETAEVYAQELGWPEPELLDALSMARSAEDILAELPGKGDRIAIVGHMPTVGEVVGLAVMAQRSGVQPFGTGTVAKVEFSGEPRIGSGTLCWQYSCEQLIGD